MAVSYLQAARLRSGLDADKPSTAVEGDVYWATDIDTLYVWDGSSWLALAGGTAGNHNILSGTHPDTLGAAVQPGDLMVGNATPKWSRLAKGTANYVLKAGASLLAWGQVAFSELTGTLSDGQHGSRGSGLHADSHAAATVGADAEHSFAGQVLSGADAAAAQKGHIQLAGQLGGTAAAPDVRGLRETAGPTLLALAAIADGKFLKRSGATVVGDDPSGGGHTIYDETNALPAEDFLRFRGGGVKALDVPGSTATDVYVGRDFDAIVDSTEPGAGNGNIYSTLATAIAAGHKSIFVRSMADAGAVTILNTDPVERIVGASPASTACSQNLTVNTGKDDILIESLRFNGTTLTLNGARANVFSCSFSTTGKIVIKGNGCQVLFCKFVLCTDVCIQINDGQSAGANYTKIINNDFILCSGEHVIEIRIYTTGTTSYPEAGSLTANLFQGNTTKRPLVAFRSQYQTVGPAGADKETDVGGPLNWAFTSNSFLTFANGALYLKGSLFNIAGNIFDAGTKSNAEGKLTEYDNTALQDAVRGVGNAAANTRRGQEVSWMGDWLSSVQVYIRKVGTPGNLTAEIWGNFAGGDDPVTLIGGGTIGAASVGGALAWVSCSFTGSAWLTDGATGAGGIQENYQYHLVLRMDDGEGGDVVDASNYYEWGCDASSPTYDNGYGETAEVYNGAAWSDEAGVDMLFRIMTPEPQTAIHIRRHSRKLSTGHVIAGNTFVEPYVVVRNNIYITSGVPLIQVCLINGNLLEGGTSATVARTYGGTLFMYSANTVRPSTTLDLYQGGHSSLFMIGNINWSPTFDSLGSTYTFRGNSGFGDEGDYDPRTDDALDLGSTSAQLHDAFFAHGVRLKEIAAKPTAAANTGWTYTKRVAGTTELFFERDDGTEVQIT